MKKSFLLLGIICSFIFAAVSNQTLSFQGKLLDKNGAVVSGTRAMMFTMYPQAVGGTAVTNASWSQSVAVQNGIYAVELDAAAVDLTNVNDLWMEVVVAGETLNPRIHLTSNAFSKRAAFADIASTANHLLGVTVSENGNVGIGTKTPKKPLDVSGDIRIVSIYSPAQELSLYSDAGAALPLKTGSIMAGVAYVRPNPGMGNIVTNMAGLPNGSVFGLYGGAGSLPGYPTDYYPTLKTSHDNIYFSAGGTYSAYMSTNGVWTAQSDRNKKENFQEISPEDYFNRINSFKIYQWQYKDDSTKARHIGPFAQDMHQYFETPDETMLSPQDTAGTALLGVKYLVETVQAQQKQIDEQKEIIKNLNERLDALEKTE